MNFQENISLKKYNTFGIDVNAKRFISIDSVYELQQLLEKEKDLFLLSGGSNMLLTKDIEKLVVHLNIKGISIDREDENSVYLTVNAGENWHEFVLWTLEQNYGGVENLSLIPGNIGTAPIQNIGAYGLEVSHFIQSVDVLDLASGEQFVLANEECLFGYRESIFKQPQASHWMITSVTFSVPKAYQAVTTYGELKALDNPTPETVFTKVVEIRQSKLPNPTEIGNAGSFFKNPIVSKHKLKALIEHYGKVPNYPVSENEVKLAAGWLIDKAGLKGYKTNGVGVHEKQALVLVNYGTTQGKVIVDLARHVKAQVYKMFGVDLVPEVRLISAIGEFHLSDILTDGEAAHG